MLQSLTERSMQDRAARLLAQAHELADEADRVTSFQRMCGRRMDQMDFTGLHDMVTELELKEALWRAVRDLGDAAALWRTQNVSQVQLFNLISRRRRTCHPNAQGHVSDRHFRWPEWPVPRKQRCRATVQVSAAEMKLKLEDMHQLCMRVERGLVSNVAMHQLRLDVAHWRTMADILEGITSGAFVERHWVACGDVLGPLGPLTTTVAALQEQGAVQHKDRCAFALVAMAGVGGCQLVKSRLGYQRGR
jgi:hypothetical protein